MTRAGHSNYHLFLHVSKFNKSNVFQVIYHTRCGSTVYLGIYTHQPMGSAAHYMYKLKFHFLFTI